MSNLNSIEDRRIRAFWDRVNKDGPIPSHCPELGPCWIWTGAAIKGGYGVFKIAIGVSRLVHRTSWCIASGEWAGRFFVLHRCDNPSCVNPSHLRLGTHQENMAERCSKNRQARGERGGKSKLNDEKVRGIRSLWSAGRPCAEIAKLFGVGETAIRMIVNGRTWRHVA